MEKNTPAGQPRCHCLHLRRAGQAITTLYDRHLASSGLTVGQYALLSAISRLQPVSVSGLAAATGLQRTTLVRSLRPLEKRGLVADSATGGRRRQLMLTEPGCQNLNAGRALWQNAQSDLENRLGQHKIALLQDILDEIAGLT